MRLEQLQFVVTVAELKSIRQAADELYVTPQNISKSIHQLEDELKADIFNRSKTGMSLTAQGQLVYETALDILQRVDFLSNAFLTAKDFPEQAKMNGTLRILHGASLSPIIYRLQRILINRYPNINNISTEQESNHIDKFLHDLTEDTIREFPYNMVFMSTFKLDDFFSQIIYNHFDVYFLKDEKSGILMRYDDALTKKGVISLETLNSLPVVAYSTSNEPIMPIQALKNHGVNITPILTTNSFVSYEQYIRDGIAYGIVGSDYMTIRGPEHGKLAFVPFEKKITTNHFVLTKKKTLLLPHERAFLEIVRDHFINTLRLVNP